MRWYLSPRPSTTRSACCSSIRTTSPRSRAAKRRGWSSASARTLRSDSLPMPRGNSRPIHEPSSRAVRSRAVREAISRCRALIRERGEVSGAAAAREALAAYVALDSTERARFFDALASDFSPNPHAVLDAAQAYHADATPATLQRLEAVVEPA